MGKVLIEESQVNKLKEKIKFLEKLIQKSPGDLIVRWAKGVQTTVAMAIPAGDSTWNYIDGLDLTMDCDSEYVLIDWQVLGKVSTTAGTHLWRIVVDDHVDWLDYVRIQPAVTTDVIFVGFHVVRPGPGRHRYRLAFSATAALTLTLHTDARYMRAVGVVNRRWRYLNEHRA